MKKLMMRAAPVAKLRDDITNLDIGGWRSLDPDAYPYKELGEIAQKVNDLTIENRRAAFSRRNFFTNASHELKTPVTTIKGSVELLCANVPLGEEQQKELLQRIGIEAERLHNLINDIIMINKLESGETAGEKEEVDLAEVVRVCVDDVITQIEQNQLRMDIKIESVMLLANRTDVYKMFINLIANAANYTRPGGRVEIRLSTGAEKIIFSICNDADPISADHQPRIFERFYRLDNGRSKAVGGTGLGLSIVKHTVESLGGTIRLESDDRIGVLFTVVIPR